MIVLVIFSLFLLAFLTYNMARSWLFPPALYAIYWSFILLASIFINFGNVNLSIDSLLLFLLGCIFYAAGGYISLIQFGRIKHKVQVTQPRKKFIQICIIIYSIGLLGLVPFFINIIWQIGFPQTLNQFAVTARIALKSREAIGIPRYFQSLTSVGMVLAYCAAWLYDGGRRDKVVLMLAILGPLIMLSLTFARTPIYELSVGIMAIMYFRKTIRVRTILIIFTMTITLALTMGILLGKGPYFVYGKSLFLVFISNVGAVVDNMADYFIGGPLGFSEVMANPSSVGETGLSLRFFTQAVRSFGMEIELPNNVLGYFGTLTGNVYTIYYAYWLDWGWVGIICMAFLAGFLSTTVYSLARRNNPIGGVAMGLVISSILNSAVGDGIFGSSIPWVLIILIVSLLWHIRIRK